MQHLRNTFPGIAGTHLSQILDDRMRVACEMLIAGVAFQQTTKLWTVFSHEGEYLGELSTIVVNSATHVLKKLGLSYRRIHHGMNNVLDSITFGHDYPDQDELGKMMDRRRRKPTTIH